MERDKEKRKKRQATKKTPELNNKQNSTQWRSLNET